jgi:voltage-gated potassium channel
MIFVLIRMILTNRRLRITLTTVTLLFLVVMISSTGLWYLEAEQNLSFADCTWLSLVTMTTVGYGDICPKTTAGRMFTVFVPMMMGIGVMAYMVGLLAAGIIEKEMKLMNGKIELTCEDHILIINLQHEQKIHALIDELRKDNKSSEVPIVLVDSDLEICPDQLLKRKNFFFVHGNPLWWPTLQRSNAVKAKQIIILAKDPVHSASDGVTLQVAVMLKHVHKDVDSPATIVAEVVSKDSIDALKIVGVKHVICLEKIIPPILIQCLKGEYDGYA